jgi:protein-S-isoprenylcysteine O-methyltransferase
MTHFNPTTQPLPVILFWLSFLVWVCFWVTMALRKNTASSAADRGSRLVIVVSLWSGVLLAFLLAWLVPAAQIGGNGWVLVIIGCFLIGAGIGLRIWAIRALGRFFRTVVVIQEDHQLIDDGPYHVLRHPSYTGTLLSVAGIGIGLGNWLSIIVAVGLTLAGFVRRIILEESALHDQFGASYEAYAQRTWRLVPLVW